MRTPETPWPNELASLGAIRFARTYYHYDEAVHFYRDLVGLPLYEQFEGSYGENGSIFGGENEPAGGSSGKHPFPPPPAMRR